MSCAAPPKQPRPAAASALAPGFRFHPTDEELVSYYLKRKVAGRPFRVDAISEIDLYKAEPWDLPGKSRIQNRDNEWYFFSALDKKYSNRSRTNRATGSGYWKTTGKDRSVCRGGRTVGMKKTLVFHVGRAPKGERSNWVMHEYRLEDEELTRAGVPQDAFVVCRIFQKRGPGPQNGAQYGAPLVEEEWDDDELPILKAEDGEDALNILGNSGPTGTDDYDQNSSLFDPQIQDMGVQGEKTALLVLDWEDDFFDPDSLLKICEDKLLNDGKDGSIEVPGQQYYQDLKEECNECDAADQNQGLAVLNDEFLELNDFASPMDGSCVVSVICPQEVHNDTNFINGEISSQQELHNMEDNFNTDNENNPSELFSQCQTVENNCFVEFNDLLGPEDGTYTSGDPGSDGIPYFDAPNHFLDANHGLSADVNNFMDSTIASSSEPDPVAEWIAYFDDTENMQSSILDLNSRTNTPKESNLAPVNGHDVQTYQMSSQPSNIDVGNGLPSVTPNTDKHSSVQSVNIYGQSDTQYNSSWDTAFAKRLVNMLGAIPSSPAFAAEYPSKLTKSIEHYSAAHSSSSMDVAAGMIQIHGVTMPGTGKNWSTLKNGDTGFLLSYGMTHDETDNLAAYNTMGKIPGGMKAFVIRNSFHLLFLSVLFLAASFKIWVCIYGR